MTRKISACRFAFLLFCTTLFLSGCGFWGGQNERMKIRIAYFPNIIHTQALILKNQCSLEEAWNESCDVEWISFNAGPSEIEAIFAGEVDIGYIGPVPALNANVKSKGDVKIIANATNEGAVFFVRKNSGVTSVNDLSGKKIAVPQLGNTQHLCLLSILKENGLQTKEQGGDVTILASSNADILNLMDNGSIDGAVVPEPWGTMIENKENADILLDYDEIFPGGAYPSAVVIANGDFLKNHPDLVRQFLQQHKDATQLIKDAPDETLSIVNEEIKAATGKALGTDILKRAFSRIEAEDELNTDAVMRFAAIGSDEGFINEIPEENDVFNLELGQ